VVGVVVGCGFEVVVFGAVVVGCLTVVLVCGFVVEVFGTVVDEVDVVVGAGPT
jgi:hypothetical protein